PDHDTSAPAARMGRIRTAVSLVTWRHPATFIPLSGRSFFPASRRCISTGIRLSAHSMRSRPASASLASAILKFDIRGTLLFGVHRVKQSQAKSFTIGPPQTPNALSSSAGVGGLLAASRDRRRVADRALVLARGGRPRRAGARQGRNLLRRRVLGDGAGLRAAAPAVAWPGPARLAAGAGRAAVLLLGRHRGEPAALRRRAPAPADSPHPAGPGAGGRL